MWPRDAHVGQRVVCVVGPQDGEPAPHTSVGEVYTIARVSIDEEFNVMLDFKEFGIPVEDWILTDVWAWSSSFAAIDYLPVQKHNRSTETGMEKLRSFLKDAKQPVEEEA